MPESTVKWFSEAKGYGFIACPEGGGDIFVHDCQIEGSDYRTLEGGDRVQFDIERGPRGRYATKVRGPRRPARSLLLSEEDQTADAPPPEAAAC